MKPTPSNRPPLVILTGKKDTRLGKLTKDIPTPMVDIFGKPFLYWLLEHYIEQGFTDIIISTGYKAEAIENYPWPYKLTFIREHEIIQDHFYRPGTLHSNPIVVDGNRWIHDALPSDMEGPWILAGFGYDIGVQFVSEGKVRILNTLNSFYDIGSPVGLKCFKYYFKSYALSKKTHRRPLKKV